MKQTNNDWLAYICGKQGKLDELDLQMLTDYCSALGLNAIEVSQDHIKAVTEDAVSEFKTVAEKVYGAASRVDETI